MWYVNVLVLGMLILVGIYSLWISGGKGDGE